MNMLKETILTLCVLAAADYTAVEAARLQDSADASIRTSASVRESWGHAETIAAASALIALVSLVVAYRSLSASLASAKAAAESVGAAREATQVAKDIARRQNVIELHNAWDPVNAIDPANPVGPDCRKAVNALALTATLWNHDVMEHEILFQNYWGSYRDLFHALDAITSPIPGQPKSGRDALTAEIRKVYEDMKQHELGQVRQSTMSRGIRS